MKTNPSRLLALAAALLWASLPATATAEQLPPGECVIVSGGPALGRWERHRSEPHDIWWGNFIRGARVSIQALRKQHGPTLPITWLVYQKSYRTRSSEDGRSLVELVNSVRDAYGVNLINFDSTEQVINYLNNGQPRDRMKIAHFEFHGHSNKACFMFDYSNHMANASECWLHQNDLNRIHRGIFARGAFVKSWGCHTGESMSKKWRQATGVAMWGAIGKTTYRDGHLRNWIPALAGEDGRWTR